MEGVLHITVKEGRNFPPRDKSGFSDVSFYYSTHIFLTLKPYCVFIVNGKKHKETTSVRPQTNDPKFDEYFELTIKNSHEVKYEKRGDLVVEIWNWDRIYPDSFIGRAIVPLQDIPEEEVRKWYPLQSKPKFFQKVHGHIMLELWIEWRPLRHSLSTFSRINQKIGAKLIQVGRVGAHYLGRRMLNVKNWGIRTTHFKVLMKQLKPPKYAHSKETISQVHKNTYLSEEELEQLYYAFRSFAYPNEQMTKESLCQVYPTLRNKQELVHAIMSSFLLHPNDQILFSAFVIAISDVTRGKQHERLRVVARFFEEGGYVGKAKFQTLVENLTSIFTAHPVDIALLSTEIFGSEEKIHASSFTAALIALETRDEKRHLLRKPDKDVHGPSYCFGLFHYLYESLLDRLEHVMERSAAVLKPEKEGFLMKKSGGSWAKYWFCLRNGFLFYYRDPSDKNPARVLYLEGSCTVYKTPQVEGIVDTSISFVMDALNPPNEDSTSTSIPIAGNRTRSRSLTHDTPPPLTRSRSATISTPSAARALRSSVANYPPHDFFLPPKFPASPTAIQDSVIEPPSTPPHSASVPNLPALPLPSKPLPPIPKSDPIPHIHKFNPPAPSSPPIPIPNLSTSATTGFTSSLPSNLSTSIPTNFSSSSLPNDVSSSPPLTPSSSSSSVSSFRNSSHFKPLPPVPSKLDSVQNPAILISQPPEVNRNNNTFHPSTSPPPTSGSPVLQVPQNASTKLNVVANPPPPADSSTQISTLSPRPRPIRPTSANMNDAELATLRNQKAAKKKRDFVAASLFNTFQITVGNYTMILAAHDHRHKEKWMDRIRFHSSGRSEHPYSSFAPVRPKSGAKYFIDGRDYYEAVAEAILSAREQIYITDWFFSPEIYLKRTAEGMSHRLDHLLATKAKEGVKIFVIIWSETKFAMNLNSERAKTYLEALHRNITIICHPILLMKWSHHQKTVVIDQDVAFLGGLDLCFGRYDTPAHPLEDAHYKTYPGKDYYNPAKGGELDGLEYPFKDLVDRLHVPRMPWHDVSVRVDGYAARDIAKNFIQRWNHHRNDIQMVSPLLIPKTVLWAHSDTKTCQVLRSLSSWSGQNGDKTECSIYEAMLSSIKNAKHFIYIENQYFISSTAGGKVKNEIAEALITRIRQAILEKQAQDLSFPNFRVVIVLPIHPEGTYKDSNSIRCILPFDITIFSDSQDIMKWQYDTICRGGNSIIERLEAEFPKEFIGDYISFYALRNHGILGGEVVTEQIYVHTKLMIVDDRTVIVGSANINDRSLLGDRDSEIAVIIEDESLVPSKMRGQPYMACKFALSLRLDLWREHLGLSHENINSVMDPISYETYDLIWRNTARNNTSIYTSAFGVLEGDSVERVRDIENVCSTPASAEVLSKLTQVQGHLVEYPLNFLLSSLGDSFSLSVDILVAGDDVFQ